MDPCSIGGKSLPAASYGLFPNLKKKVSFAIRDGSRIFIICFVYTSGQLSYTWPAPTTFYRPFCEHGDPRVGSEPLTSALRSEFMTQSLVLSIDVCRGLGISPLRAEHPPEFFRSRPRPNIGHNCFLGGFGKCGTFRLSNRAHSKQAVTE